MTIAFAGVVLQSSASAEGAAVAAERVVGELSDVFVPGSGDEALAMVEGAGSVASRHQISVHHGPPSVRQAFAYPGPTSFAQWSAGYW